MISMQYHSKNLSCHYQYAPHSKVDIPQIRRNPPDMLLFCPKPNIIDYLPPRQPVEEVARRPGHLPGVVAGQDEDLPNFLI